MYALTVLNMKVRGEIIYEISHPMNVLTLMGSSVSVCWLPSHYGLLFNDWADRAAKADALNKPRGITINIPVPIHEVCINLERYHFVSTETKTEYYSFYLHDYQWCKKRIVHLCNSCNITHL